MPTTFRANTAEGYEQAMGRWSRDLAEPLLDFAGVSAGARVLDAGCGTGSLLPALLARGVDGIVALDQADAYLDYARARHLDPRVTFRKGDLCALDLADDAMDAALCQLVLQFVPDPLAGLVELARVVRPGGVVAGTVWDHFGGHVTARMVLDTAAVLDAEGVLPHRAALLASPASRPGGLAALWRRAGLASVEQRALVVRMTFSGFAEFWAPIAAGDSRMGRYVERLAPALRMALEAAVRAAYLCGEADGERSFSSVALACRGRVPAR